MSHLPQPPLYSAAIQRLSADLPPIPHKATAPHPCVSCFLARTRYPDASLKGGATVYWRSFAALAGYPVVRQTLPLRQQRSTLSFGTCVRGSSMLAPYFPSSGGTSVVEQV